MIALPQIELAAYILFYEKVAQTIECVQSLLPSGINIYVLNNNSSAESRRVLGEFCASHPQVTIFDSEENLGVSRGRNSLISRTSEQWMLFMDNDIVVRTENWTDVLRKNMQKYPHAEVFVPRLFNVHENSYVSYNTLELGNNRVHHVPLKDDTANSFPGGASFVNRKVFQRLGLYDEGMFIELEDYEFAIRGILAGKPVRAILIDDIELVHDHRPVQSVEDKKAVLTRYKMSNGEKSLRRIQGKYKDLIFVHEWRPWVSEQVDQLISNDEIDLSLTTPQKNFGCAAASRLSTVPGNECLNASRINEEFSKLIEKSRPERAVFVGNNGIGTDRLLPHLETVVVENSPQFSCRSKYNYLNFCCSFTDYRDLERLFQQLSSSELQAILVANCLERLSDPRPLLRTLKRLLLLHPYNRLVIASPSRSEGILTMPENCCRIREWSFTELLRFLKSSGFVVEEAREISGTGSDTGSESFVVLSLTREQYEVFLQRQYLPGSETEYLIFSNEHGKAKLTGGIGSYVEEMQAIIPEKLMGICILGAGELVPDQWVVKQERIIVPQAFHEQSYIDSVPRTEVALQLGEQSVFFYTELNVIEYQDIEGYGVRFPQAKAAGLIPPEVLLKVCCHGPKIYLENNSQRWYGLDDLRLTEEERVAIESSDVVNFPTKFMYDLCTDAGYNIAPGKVCRFRLPFSYKYSAQHDYKKLDTLLFFGKRVTNKGFSDFASAIKLLQAKGDLASIKKIILLGPKFDYMPDENLFFENLKKDLEVEELSLSRAEAIQTIIANAENALCIIPYKNDNHPYSVLETVSTGCQFLTVRAGGIPELIPAAFHDFTMCEPNPESVAKGIIRAFEHSVEDRAATLRSLLATVRREQAVINDSNLEALEKSRICIAKTETEVSKGTVAVLVYCDVLRTQALYRMASALNGQTSLPSKVIFVLDGVDDTTERKLTSFLGNNVSYDFEVNRNGSGQGFAVSNNEVLSALSCDYLVTLIVSTLISDNLIEHYVNYLSNKQDSMSVTSYYDVIDQDSVTQDSVSKYTVRPLGDFSLLLGQNNNGFGHPNSAYRVDTLQKLQGWKETAGSNASTWALFLKIKSSGYKIGVIPRSLVTIPIADATTTIDSSKFASQRDLALNTLSLDKAGAFRLQGLLSYYSSEVMNQLELKDQLIQELTGMLTSKLMEKDAEIRNMHCSISWKMTAPLRWVLTSLYKLMNRKT